MNFFSIDLCKEMQAAGLVSESGFWYWFSEEDYEWTVRSWEPVQSPHVIGVYAIPAFTAFDLIAPTETARSNAKKWFQKSEDSLLWLERIHNLVDLDTTKESVEDYVRRMRRK